MNIYPIRILYGPVEFVFRPKGADEGPEITLLCVHLLYAAEEERLRQAKWLSHHLHDRMFSQGQTSPIIVAGDFNGAPWSPTGQNMRSQPGIRYVPRINGNSSYYDHFYANESAAEKISGASSFVITPSQYNEDAVSFFKKIVGDQWQMTYSDHYPVLIDLQTDEPAKNDR